MGPKKVQSNFSTSASSSSKKSKHGSSTDNADDPTMSSPSTPKKSKTGSSTNTVSDQTSPSTPKTDLGYHGYVLKLSNIKASPSKVKYFRATLHDGTDEKFVLSYNPSLHEVMNSAKLTDKPVRLLNFSEKIDEFNDKPLLTLANQSTVEYSKENIPFAKVKAIFGKLNSFTPLSEIMNEVCVGEVVNITARVDLKNSEIIEVNTRYGIKRKRDVIVYDNTYYSVKLCLWNAHIDSVDTSGSYKLQHVRINSYNGKYITTTAGSIIRKSDDEFEKKEITTEITFEKITLPAESINIFDQCFYCKKCKRKAQPSGSFIVCDSCGSRSLLKSDDQRFNVKITMAESTDNGKTSLTIPHEMYIKLADLLETDLKNVDEMQIKLLTCESVALIYSTKNFIVTDVMKVI